MSSPVQDLITGCRILDGERLTDAFGHLSIRLNDGSGLLLSARIGPGLVRGPADVLTVSADGAVLDGDPALLPGEAAVHVGLLAARPEINSVCRYHGHHSMAYSTLGVGLPATTGLALMLGYEVPVHDTALTVTTADAAAGLAATLGSAGGVLLRGFGAVTVGNTVAHAVVRAIFLERAAAAQLLASAIGEPVRYTAAQAEAFAARENVIAEQIRRAWTYLCDRWPEQVVA